MDTSKIATKVQQTKSRFGSSWVCLHEPQPTPFVPHHHGIVSRKRNRSKIALLLGFYMVASTSPFGVLHRHHSPPRRMMLADGPYASAVSHIESLERRSTSALFCNFREPWLGTNTTNGRSNYTVYGRRFDGGTIVSECAIEKDAARLIASNQKSPGIHGFTNGWDAKWINASSFNVHDLSTSDWIEVENYWDRIMPAVSYLGTEKVAKIYKALCVAYSAHRGQKRKSGEPFIVHVCMIALS
jgi:hypothetical protein